MFIAGTESEKGIANYQKWCILYEKSAWNWGRETKKTTTRSPRRGKFPNLIKSFHSLFWNYNKAQKGKERESIVS